MMDMTLEMESDTTTPFLSDLDLEMQKQADKLEGSANLDSAVSPADLRTESKDEEWSSSTETKRYITTPPSASASFLSMPDPLSSSSTTSVQYDTIQLSDYASVIESAKDISSPSIISQAIPERDDLSKVDRRLLTHQSEQPEHRDDLDHSDHEGSGSEAESESSFPSVTSSFFFSSPASVASHGPSDSSHEESNEDAGSESSRARGLRVTQELIIPSLTLPEALFLPNATPGQYPLETPHASKYSYSRIHEGHGALSEMDAMCLLIVTPSEGKEDITSNRPSLSEKMKKELDDAISISREGSQIKLRSVVPPGQDVESVLTTVVNSFSANELFTAVVLVSDIPDAARNEFAQLTNALSPFVPVIHLLQNGSAASTSRSSPLVPSAALSVSSVQELHDLLTERPEVSQQLRMEAVEKFMTWVANRRKDEGTTQLKDGIPSIVDRRARSRRVHGHADDINMLGHVKEETVILGSGNDRSRADSEGSWRQFKAQWEASWEDAYSGQGQEHLSRKVALKDRRERSSTPRDTSDDDLLRTARIISAGPAFAVGASTLKVRKQPRSRKPAFNRESSSSSSSPRPATSPSLPASSSLPSTMPSSLSLSESFFISADEVPETPSLPLVPLVMAFPFPSSTVSLLPPPSRDPSRARSRGVTPGSVSPYPSETSTPFIFDLHAGRFDPLHLPSFIALSFSILRPLRAHMWSATHRLLTAPFRVASTAGDDEKDVRKVDEQMEDHKLAFSFDSIDTEEYNPEPSSSSSAYRFRRALWPTGVMLVGGFLLGFAVGYLRVF